MWEYKILCFGGILETKGLPNFSNAVLSIMGKITQEIMSDDDLKKMIGALTDFDDFATATA